MGGKQDCQLTANIFLHSLSSLSIRSWWLLCSALMMGKSQGLNRELEKQIVDKILGEGYDKRIRPSGINNKTGQNG